MLILPDFKKFSVCLAKSAVEYFSSFLKVVIQFSFDIKGSKNVVLVFVGFALFCHDVSIGWLFSYFSGLFCALFESHHFLFEQQLSTIIFSQSS